MTRRAEPIRRTRPRAPRRLRATRAGWCFIAIVFGVGFAALNTGNNLLYLVLALLLAFLVLSGLLSEASLRGLRVERRLPLELFAGEPNRIGLRVHNAQRRNAAFAITLEDRFETHDGPKTAGRTFVLRIAPGSSVDRSYLFTPPRRGELELIELRASTRFPFGLFVKSSEIACRTPCLVFPRIEPMRARRSQIRTEREAGAAPTDSRRRAGEQIVGLREFFPGDSLGRVQWRRSLRARRWLVGEREGEASTEVEVRLSPTVAEPQPQIEDRISRAASEIVSHLEDGLRVGLRTPGACFAPAAGRRQRAVLLSHLARFDPVGPRSESAADGIAPR